jgi:hypothetical protein
MLQTRQFITVAGKIRRRGKTGDRVYTQLILTVFAKSRAGRLYIEQELRYKDAPANQAEAITDIGHFIYDEIKQKFL